jgi:hypothetical protein
MAVDPVDQYVFVSLPSFSEGPKTLCSAKTTVAGLATCRSTRSLAGQSSYDAAYAGTAKYAASSGTGAVVP